MKKQSKEETTKREKALINQIASQGGMKELAQSVIEHADELHGHVDDMDMEPVFRVVEEIELRLEAIGNLANQYKVQGVEAKP